MPGMDSYMDLFISPILTNNNILNSISNTNAKTQSEQVDAFEKVFDDINEQIEQEFKDINSTKKVEKSEDEEEKPDNNLLNLLGNNFGPPIGLNIENFNYSLIR